jgi:hypothetical protein
MSKLLLSSDGAALIDPTSVWIKISDENLPPAGVKMQLINKRLGIATTGTYDKNKKEFTHYAGLPVFKD